ncbi:MAG: hypothetical protein LBE16_03225, partial [Clostridiales Family XIII bacterium]|nr:hypothetical protein [Clostridiales Family XIII bacterium]
MIINHNIPALNTYRSLTINNERTSKSLSKLSSGLRITSAGDDAAGLAISEKMRSQIRGLGQASRNAYDGKSLLAVAEGALNEVHSILQRMKELAVQSANDTNTQFDRGEIQKEVEQLKTEIDRISRDTEFNTMKLLNGTMENRATVTSMTTNLIKNPDERGTYNDYNFKIEIGGAVVEAGTYTLSASFGSNATMLGTVSGMQAVGVSEDIKSKISFLNFTTLTGGGTGLGAQYGEYRLDISGNLGGSYDLTLTGPDGRYEILKSQGNSGLVTFSQIGVAFDFSGANSITGDGYITFQNVLTDALFTLMGANGTTVNLGIGGNNVIQTYTGQTLDIGGIQFKLSVGLFTLQHMKAELNVVDKSIKLHIGANAGQNMNISILDSSAKALGINKVDLKEQ